MKHENEFPDLAVNQAGAKDALVEFDDRPDREIAARELLEAILNCDRRDRIPLMERFIDALRAGPPTAPFGSVMEEATFWAAWASRNERKAYLVVIWRTLSRGDQRRFLEYAGTQ